MKARQRANAERREKLVFVEQIAQHLLQAVAGRNGQQSSASVAGTLDARNRRCAGPGPGDCPGTIAAVCENPAVARRASSSSTSTAKSGIMPTKERMRIGSSLAVRCASGRNRSRLVRPRARCRRACSWRRRSRRNARKTSRPRLRRRDRLAPVPGPSPAWSRSRTPSRRCRRLVPDGRRWASGLERSNMPMLSRPRKPPAKRCLPAMSLRLTHQVKLISSFWNTRDRKSRSRWPGGPVIL